VQIRLKCFYHYLDAHCSKVKSCLSGSLGAQFVFLPKKVKQEIKRFFKLNLKWLQIAHKFDEPINAEQKATIILPLLEKAMMVIKALGGNQFFDQATTAMN
jgi:TetR/AcrR family transcriptional repressor of nem operon